MNQTLKQSSLKQKLTQFFTIPVEIKQISFSLFLFILGWGLGGDTFFSLYVKRIIGTGIGLTLIGTLLPIIKLLVVMPIGTLNDQGESKNLLFSGKVFYAISALFYFFAGVESSVMMLVFAVIFNGLGSSTMYTTYRSLYGNKSKTENRSQIFGIYFSSINIAYVIGAIISAWLVGYLDLEYMYLFIVIFALISILQDTKIQDFIKQHSSKKKKNRLLRSGYSFREEVLHGVKKIQNFVSSSGFLARFIKAIFSLKTRKHTFEALKGYSMDMYISLGALSLVSFVNYIGYLFIPLIAVEKNLSLSQIAILFAVMRLPYLINIFVGNLGDKYNKKLLISIFVTFLAGIFIFMGSVSDFSMILVLSFGISLIVAILQPITSALMLDYANANDKGLMAGLQELVNKVGEIIGSLGFGVLSGFLGMQGAFQLVGIMMGGLGIYCLSKKLLIRK